MVPALLAVEDEDAAPFGWRLIPAADFRPASHKLALGVYRPLDPPEQTWVDALGAHEEDVLAWLARLAATPTLREENRRGLARAMLVYERRTRCRIEVERALFTLTGDPRC